MLEKTKKSEKKKTDYQKTEVKKEVVKQFTYLGPTIIRPVQLSHCQVLKLPVSETINGLIEDKLLKHLFVDVKELSKAMNETSDPKSGRSQLIKRASKKIKEIANEL